MAKALEWLFKMQDRMSGPAQQIFEKLDMVQGKLHGVSEATDKVAARGDFLAAQKESTEQLMGTLGGVVAGATAAAAAVGAVGVALAGAAIHAASFKQNTLQALTVMTGSEDVAKDMYSEISKLADQSTFKTQDVAQNYKALVGGGFQRPEINDTLKGVADVGAVVGGDQGKQAADSIIQQMLQVRSIGKLAYEDLKQISQASVGIIPIDKVAANLAQMRHVTQSEAMKMISAGTITAAEGQKAILDTIRQQADHGGELGSAAKKLGLESLPGQISTLQSRFSKLFEDVDIGPITAVVAKVTEFLDSKPGLEFKQTLTDAFSSVFAKVGAIATDGRLTGWLTQGANAVEWLMGAFATAWPIVEAFWDGLSSALGIAWGIGSKVFSAIGSAVTTVITSFSGLNSATPTLVHGFTMFAEVLGYVVGGVVAVVAVGAAMIAVVGDLIGIAIGAGAALAGMAGDILTTFEALPDMLMAAGTNLIDGLWEGIKSGWANLVANFEGLVQLLPDTVKKVLGIASPSKVMAGLAVNTVEGFTNVIDRSGPTVAAKVSSIFDTPMDSLPAINAPSLGSDAPPSGVTVTATGDAEATAGGRGAGGGVGDVEINIYIDGAGGQDAKELGDQIAQRVREEWAKLMSGVATEMGAF